MQGGGGWGPAFAEAPGGLSVGWKGGCHPRWGWRWREGRRGDGGETAVGTVLQKHRAALSGHFEGGWAVVSTGGCGWYKLLSFNSSWGCDSSCSLQLRRCGHSSCTGAVRQFAGRHPGAEARLLQSGREGFPGAVVGVGLPGHISEHLCMARKPLSAFQSIFL